MTRLVVVSILLMACGDAPRVHHKPTAPVDLELTQRWVGGAEYELTLTARPTSDVTSLELALDGRRQYIGRSRAGAAHTMTMRVQLVGAGRQVVGAAAVQVRGHRRNTAAAVTIGKEPSRRLTSRIVVLPDGTRVDEVRP